MTDLLDEALAQLLGRPVYDALNKHLADGQRAEAAVERARKLHRRNDHTGDCEYCSARDYPDYSVPYPCDTVQALDGQPGPAATEATQPDGSVTAAFTGLVAGVRRAAASTQDDFALSDGSASPLRELIAAAIYERNNPGHAWADAHPDDRICYGNDADAALTVVQPGARITATLARMSESDVQRVIALYERWVKAGPPPLGVSLARWWDKRLVELHEAIRPIDSQTEEK
ncbi:hypothetical protein [Streptomyces sp. NPDC060001]|uniref:hypothetical protein n=1 Tax=Streptomyces sp. NPDC060001 TaxID=3347032 RepID=UPI0036816610